MATMGHLIIVVAAILDCFILSQGRNITCPETVCECREMLETVHRVIEKVIDCSDLDLDKVPNFLAFSQLNFDTLLLNNNKITSLTRGAFRGLNVKTIDLSDNRELSSFSNYAFHYVTSLEVLKIENAQMSSAPIGFKDLPELRELHLKNNNIRRLPSTAFSSMTKLRHLDMANNQVEFPIGFNAFDQLTELEYLDLEGNGLYNIPVDGIRKKPKLKSLILGNNNIKNIPMESLQALKSLRRLELVANPITFTKPAEGIFPGLDLEILSVGGCTMDSISPQTLNGVPKLTNLTIRECKIKSIPKGTFKVLRHLRALDVSGNPFRLSPEVFYGVENQLDFLKLEKMNLTKYPLDLLGRFPRLKDIFLSQNNIEFLPGGIFQKLPYRGSRIVVEDNKINKVSTHLMDRVRAPASLHLANNKIRSLEFISKYPCRYDDVFIDVSNNPVHCDCETYEVIQRKIFELVGTCQSPPKHENLKLLYWPGMKSEVAHFEHSVNLTENCEAQHRLNQRYECTCGTWQNVDSPVVCAVVGASTRPTNSFILQSLVLASILCQILLW